MMIQAVEAKELIGRIVPERRPLAFPEAARRDEPADNRRLKIALLVCMIVVVSFGGLIACALELLLDGFYNAAL